VPTHTRGPTLVMERCGGATALSMSGAAFDLVFELPASTYAACYVLTKVGRPYIALPKGSEFLFKTPGALV
jgi:hypothetical protein